MTNCQFKTTTFTTINELKQGPVTLTGYYQLTWDNFLLITHYDERQTFVLLQDGRRLVIDKPLKQALKDFSTINHCYQRCTIPYYDILGEKHPIRAFVAGKNLLVPSMGIQNSEVVYYMAKPLKGHYYLDDQQEMMLLFEMDQESLNISVPAYQRKFDKILQQADAISQMHLVELHEMEHRYGIERDCACYGNQYYERAELTAKAFEIKRHVYGYVLNSLHERLYGERLSEEGMERLLEVLFDTFKR
ncbi:MAG TPA: hypothetical protein H9792_05345 [Candidatus Limosilactobacillus excrementigallinarum]|nr:hypothetical protein [Candidatus Limosilactobacillus excrementigallinarum]